MKSWAITLKSGYIRAFLEGRKKYEIRTRVPSALGIGDTIYFVEKNSSGTVRMRGEVAAILKLPPFTAWRKFRGELGITLNPYLKYCTGHGMMVYLEITNIEKVPEGFKVDNLGMSRAPLWFSEVKGGAK